MMIFNEYCIATGKLPMFCILQVHLVHEKNTLSFFNIHFRMTQLFKEKDSVIEMFQRDVTSEMNGYRMKTVFPPLVVFISL